MSAFEDDVEPLDEPRSRGGTPFGRRSGAAAAVAQASGSAGGSDAAASTSRVLSPEPDEDLDTTDGKHSMWLVKVPRFLLEGWTKVDEEKRRLGTVRVYDPDHRGRQRMELLLPEAPEPAIPLPPSHPYLQTNFPRKYDLRLMSEAGAVRVRNLYAFKERQEGGDEDDEDDEDEDDVDSGAEDVKGKKRAASSAVDDDRRKGRRVVAMVGTIANEAALKPQVAPPIMRTGGASSVGITPEYREVLRKRRLEASKPRVSVKVLDESDRSHANMLSSGVSAHTTKPTKASLIAGTGAAAAASAAARRNHASNEKFARMPRNELLDLLFELFDQYPYWSIKGLRAKVQQPEVYLREVMTSIADLHKRGPYAGNWSLKQEFVELRRQQDREANAIAASTVASSSSSSSSAATAAAPLNNVAPPMQPPAPHLNGGSGVAKREDGVKPEGSDDDDEEEMEMEDVT